MIAHLQGGTICFGIYACEAAEQIGACWLARAHMHIYIYAYILDIYMHVCLCVAACLRFVRTCTLSFGE